MGTLLFIAYMRNVCFSKDLCRPDIYQLAELPHRLALWKKEHFLTCVHKTHRFVKFHILEPMLCFITIDGQIISVSVRLPYIFIVFIYKIHSGHKECICSPNVMTDWLRHLDLRFLKVNICECHRLLDTGFILGCML